MNRMQKSRSALAVAALLLGTAGAAVVPGAFAAGQPGSSASASTAMPAADKQFAMKAAQGGMAEVELGKLAQSKAQNEKVKAFGARMATDHANAGDKLKQIAQKD